MKPREADRPGEPPHPDILALRHMFAKNQWLIGIRWIYPAFILAFFVFYRIMARRSLITAHDALLVFLLPVIVNILFRMDLGRKEKRTDRPPAYDELQRLVALQLDFDMVVLSLTVFFSGGLASPLIAMLLVYIMIATFLVDYHQAFRCTLAAMALLLAVTLLREGASLFSGQQLMSLLAFYFMFIFTYLVSGYLSKNMRGNEALLKDLLQQTRQLSVSDGLTGLYNQKHFFELLARETRQSQRHDLNFSLIIFDVDYFKNFNDHHGHLRGSETLKEIAAVMKTKFRSTDLLAKYGGDEFVVILPQTDGVGAYLAAERLRESIEREPFPGAETQPQKRITISVGLASYPEHGTSDQEILNHADKALYFAKETGRNRTVIYDEAIEKETDEPG
ncbi:MAG: GGDEF domain-containing protein [Candidatus Aminicenantes bacterium]|nr:GGDEF domain-containing protein [Candidatus Aminicenantes bacterium]